jgi:hypothetical protein
MIRQARTGDIGGSVSQEYREMTGRNHTLSWWLGGEGVKTTDNKLHFPRWSGAFLSVSIIRVSVKASEYEEQFSDQENS